ncbi:RtcB family protein [Myxococcota bacterium]|nr:RtcB family protein [Myxococcota bacterium]
MSNETPQYQTLPSQGHPIKAWVRGVAVEPEAQRQLENIASLPFIYKHVAVMPDVHLGKGATVGSVIPTTEAIIPAAVGVDLGCGMIAQRTTLRAEHLPDDLRPLRLKIERAVPHGRSDNGGKNDRGAWNDPRERIRAAWGQLAPGFKRIVEKHPKVGQSNNANQLGTLGTGNHFIEVCLDTEGVVWLMLHSGSRGVGNKIGTYFIEKAREEMLKLDIHLPDRDLGYLREGTESFDDYVEAVSWAQSYAAMNRALMMEAVVDAARTTLPPFELTDVAVNCHHNYIARETHFGEEVWVTRKGAVRAGLGELGIIPGSMGAKSFIVRGKGNAESFCSCSHGAGRSMSRTKAKKMFTVADQIRATEGVECRKDADVIDEIPMAYKPIDDVMAAQSELVEIVATLRQVVCVKG